MTTGGRGSGRGSQWIHETLTSHLPLKVIPHLGDLLRVLLQGREAGRYQTHTEASPWGWPGPSGVWKIQPRKPGAVLLGAGFPSCPSSCPLLRVMWLWSPPCFVIPLPQLKSPLSSTQSEQMFQTLQPCLAFGLVCPQAMDHWPHLHRAAGSFRCLLTCLSWGLKSMLTVTRNHFE